MILKKFEITPKILNLVAKIDRFRGQWTVFGHFPENRLDLISKKARFQALQALLRLDQIEFEEKSVNLAVDGEKKEVEPAVLHCQAALDLLEERFGRAELAIPFAQELTACIEPDDERDLSHLQEVFDQSASDFLSPDMHPLLTAGLLYRSLLCAEDLGSMQQRLSALLLRAALLKSGYLYLLSSAPEAALLRKAEEFKAFLQENPDTPEANTAFLELFLEALSEDKDCLAEALELETRLLQFPELDEKIISLSMEAGRVTISEVERTTEVNRNTIKGRLRELVSQGYLARHGQGKSTWYTCSL